MKKYVEVQTGKELTVEELKNSHTKHTELMGCFDMSFEEYLQLAVEYDLIEEK